MDLFNVSKLSKCEINSLHNMTCQKTRKVCIALNWIYKRAKFMKIFLKLSTICIELKYGSVGISFLTQLWPVIKYLQEYWLENNFFNLKLTLNTTSIIFNRSHLTLKFFVIFCIFTFVMGIKHQKLFMLLASLFSL